MTRSPRLSCAARGLPPTRCRPALTPELMELVGKLLATSLQGTIDQLALRSLVKQEVQADVTMVVVRNNNPLKFFPDSPTVLTQMLRKKMPGFMEPLEAVDDACHDAARPPARRRGRLPRQHGQRDPAPARRRSSRRRCQPSGAARRADPVAPPGRAVARIRAPVRRAGRRGDRTSSRARSAPPSSKPTSRKSTASTRKPAMADRSPLALSWAQHQRPRHARIEPGRHRRRPQGRPGLLRRRRRRRRPRRRRSRLAHRGRIDDRQLRAPNRHSAPMPCSSCVDQASAGVAQRQAQRPANGQDMSTTLAALLVDRAAGARGLGPPGRHPRLPVPRRPPACASARTTASRSS